MIHVFFYHISLQLHNRVSCYGFIEFISHEVAEKVLACSLRIKSIGFFFFYSILSLWITTAVVRTALIQPQ
jgi:hypothetical protein